MRLCSNCCHIHLCFDVNVFYGMTLTRVFGRLWVGFIRMHLFFYACVVLYWHTCRTLNIYLFLCHTCFHEISHPLLQNLRLCYIVAVSVYSFSKNIHNMTHASFGIHINVCVFAHLCDLWFHVSISERMRCFRKMHACDVWRIYRYFVHMWIFVEESVTFCVRKRKFCTHVFWWSHACVCFDAICFCFVHMFVIRRVCVIWKPRLRLMFDIHDYFGYIFVYLQLHLLNENQHVCVFVDVSVMYVLYSVDVVTQVLLWWHAYVWLSAHLCDIGTNLSIRLRMQDCHTSVIVFCRWGCH
jgi:hypothetical protein